MTDRNDIFAGDNPFELFETWLSKASETEPNDPNAMALATVDENGLPDVRIVLLKEIENGSLVFFTNYESRKGQELIHAGKAAVNFHWKSLERQVRFRGTVEKTEPDVSDAYYASRPLGSRIGAWASAQSRPLASKAELVARVARYTAKFGMNPPRPPHWGGFRLVPSEVEFWAAGAYRLHDRFRWTRDGVAEKWQIQRLNP